MDLYFLPTSLERKYSDERKMKKKYGEEIANGMYYFLQIARHANNACDLKNMPFLYFEHKKGNLRNYYAVSLDKKKSKRRLMLQLLNEKFEVVIPAANEEQFLKLITKLRIGELSEHYGK